MCHFAEYSKGCREPDKWCNYTIVVTQIQCRRICFILSERSDFHIVVRLEITVYALSMQMLTLLSVDEILLPKCMNWSINFRGLVFNEVHHLNFNKMPEEKARWELHKDAVCCFESILEAAPPNNKFMATYLSFHKLSKQNMQVIAGKARIKS